MITISNVITSINNVLADNFNTIKRESSDVREGFTRPSFYVVAESNKSSSYMSAHKENLITAKIHYFPTSKDKYRIELLEMQDKLESAFFQKLKITNSFYLNIDEIEFDIADGVLIASMDLNMLQEVTDPATYESMENIEINMELKQESEV